MNRRHKINKLEKRIAKEAVFIRKKIIFIRELCRGLDRSNPFDDTKQVKKKRHEAIKRVQAYYLIDYAEAKNWVIRAFSEIGGF